MWGRLLAHLILAYALVVGFENLPRTFFGSARPPMAWFPLVLCAVSQAAIVWPRPKVFWYATAAKLGYVYYYCRWILPHAIHTPTQQVHTMLQAFILLAHAIAAPVLLVLSDVKAAVAART